MFLNLNFQGGFGGRGIEGKLLAAEYARKNKKPFLGICLGLQLAAVEIYRTELECSEANSEEMDKSTKTPIVIFMPEVNPDALGGTMRLGMKETIIKSEKSLAHRIYGGAEIAKERHRHRYEINPEYIAKLESLGIIFSGTDEEGKRMEILELDQQIHPFYFATQYHPEFKTSPYTPSPPFYALLLAASNQLQTKYAI